MQSYINDPIKRKARAAWKNMKSRCYNPNHKDYHRYGGRGIKICDEWLDSFLPFYDWSLANGIEPNLSIDRLNNDGDYTPDNCAWRTPKEQGNNRSTNVFVEFNGERKTVQQWAESLGITHQAMFARLGSDAWTLDEALTVAPEKRKVRQPSFCKSVAQVSLGGDVIKVWDSIAEAAAAVGVPASNISRSLATGYATRGYRWKYADNFNNRKETI